MRNASRLRIALRYAFPATCMVMGTWQLYRLHWKKNLIQQLEEGFQKKSIPLSQVPDDGLMGLEHRILRLDANRDASSEMIYLGPRSARDLNIDWAYNLIAPITFSDGSKALMDFGRVPVGKVNQSNVPIVGPFEAILERGEKRPWGIPENDPNQKKWNYKDIEMLASHFGVRPVLFRQTTRKCNPSIVPITNPPHVNLPNRHLEYVITWYGIAILTFLFSYLRR